MRYYDHSKMYLNLKKQTRYTAAYNNITRTDRRSLH